MAQETGQWWQQVKYRQAGSILGWVLYSLLLLGSLTTIGIRGSLIGIPLLLISAVMVWGGLSLLLRKTIPGYILGSLIAISGLVALSYSLYLMLSGSVIGTLFTIPLVILGFFLLIYFVLAPKNMWFTFIQEGTAKAVMRGDKFQKALIQWEGRTFGTVDERTWEVVPGQERHLFGGLRFFGLYPLDYIYRYYFEWTGLKPDGITPLPHEKELLDYIMLKQDVYFSKTEEAEDKERLPLDVSFVLTIKITNPYRTLFEVQNWLETIMSRTIAAVRDRISEETFEDLIAKPADIGKDIYNRLSETGNSFDEFRTKYGVDVLALEILKIDPPKEQREATLKEFVAKQEKKRILIEADAEKERLRITAEGEVLRIGAVYAKINEFGDLGKIIRALEALEKSPQQGAKWVVAVPGLGDLISTAFGGRPLAQIPPDEFRKLREALEKLLEKEGKSITTQ